MVRELQPRKFGVAQGKIESTVVFYAGQIKTKEALTAVFHYL